MPDFNPQDPGDVPYPQYSVITTMPVSDITISKGTVYTSNALGELEVVTTTVENGLFQAMGDIDIAGAASENEVQVLSPRTRMVFDDIVGSLVPGEDVILTANTSEVVTGAKTSALYAGKVFEIYTVNTDSTTKQVSEAGDKIIVETVQA